MSHGTRAGLTRGRFLGLAAAAGATVAGAGLLAGCGDDSAAAGGGARVDFHGPHQSGITTPVQTNAIVAAFDSTAATRRDLADAFQAMSYTAAGLMAGRLGAETGPLFPPTDSMIAGTELAPSALTITFGVGASLFDRRYGLEARRPAQLRPMDHFPNDRIRNRMTGGDLLIQICADTPESTNHALRRLMRDTRAALTLRWMMPGFSTRNTLPAGTTSVRNLMGFKDGTANPRASDAELMDQLVWCRPGPGVQPWMAGGTYGVYRLIRMRVEFWDREPLRTQELIFGRHKGSGAPLGQSGEADAPAYEADPTGDVIPLNAHIRLANPRTDQAMRTRMLRRSFNYSGDFTPDGQLDQGHIFICFQRDLDAGFVAAQGRLNGEPLEEYIDPFGGGYFFMLPGARRTGDWVGQSLLA